MEPNPSDGNTGGRGNPGKSKKRAPNPPVKQTGGGRSTGAGQDDDITYADEDESGDYVVLQDMSRDQTGQGAIPKRPLQSRDQTGQGAIPKRPLQREKGREMQESLRRSEDAHRGVHVRENKIETAWKQLKFVVNVNSTCHEFDGTVLVDPCQMQLISESELSRIRFNSKLKHSVCVSIQNSGVVNMKMDCSDTITRNKVITEVIGDIRQALHGTISVTETVENLNHKEGAFLSELERKIHVKMFSLEVGVYKSFDLRNLSLTIVGMMENILEVQRKIRQISEIMKTLEFSLQKHYDRDTVLSLHFLNFNGHLQQVQPDVIVIPSETDGTVVKLKGLNEDCVRKAADELEWFISKICTKTVKLPLGGIELLRQKDKIALCYVLSRLQEKNIPSYVKISGQSHECAVWCLSDSDANQAKVLIEQCIVGKSMHQSSMESVAMKEFLDLQTGKIICLKYDDEIGQLWLTDDLEAELSKLESEMESTIYRKKKSISSTAMEMLDALNVRSYINEKHEDVDYSVSSTDDSYEIEFSGTNKQNVDTAFDDISAFFQKLVFRKVKLSSNCINLLNHGNKKALTYVQSQLSKEKVPFYLQIGEDMVVIVCMDENVAVKSENVLKSCFFTKPVVGSYFDFQEGDNFLRKNDGCITIVKEEKGAISVCFTADLREELDALAYLKVGQETVDEMHTICEQLNIHTVCALQKLEFKIHLIKIHPDVKFGVSENDPSSVVMYSTSKASLDSAMNVLQSFLKQCVVKEVKLHKCHVSLLCHTNKKALEFVECTLKKKKVLVYLKAEEDKVFIICIDEDRAAKSKKIIESCLCEKTTSKVYLNTPEAKEFLRCNEGRVLSVTKDKRIDMLFYTEDLENEILKVIDNGSKTCSCRCGPLLEEFLKDYGKHILIEIEKKYQLKISFSDGLCIFNGNYEYGKQAKEEVMQKTAMNVVHLPYSQELMDYLSVAGGQSDIDIITGKLQCYWKMKEPSAPEREETGKISGVEYIGSWIFSDTGRSLSVVEGDYASKGVDLLVCPVDTSMFPAYATEIQTAGGKELMDKCIQLVNTDRGEARLGDVFIIPNEETGNLKCKMIYFISINDTQFSSQTKKGIDTFMSLSDLQTCVSKVLFEANKKGMKSIAFPLPPTKINKNFGPKRFTKAIVNAILCHFKEYKSSCVEQVLICHKESGSMDTAEAVNKIIVKGFQMTPSSFVRRKMYTDAQDVFQKCTVQTEAKFESIFNLKADCLVVAISPDLDLSKGFVASELLKRTKLLQQSLILKHPNNLKPWELVVLEVNSQSDILIKKVIFGYIPKWKEVPDAKGVKSFVTECLFAAESHRCKSVVFPALGTGNLGYPQRDIAKAMFDGVEQYRNETLHGEVKVVNIAVVRSQDDDFFPNAFFDEENRRQKHATQRVAIKHPTGFPVVVGNKTNAGQKFPIHLKVMEERFLPSPLSSEYVDVKFRFSQSGFSTKIIKVKRSSSEPFSWTDEIQVECCSNSTFETTMKLVRDECIKQKVSSLVLHCFSGFDLPEADQVEAMVNVICKYSEEYKYLRHVTISTRDNKGYIAAEKKLLSSNPGLMMSMISHSVVWSQSVEDSRPNMKISIQLVGLSKQDVDKAKQQIETLAHKQVTSAKTERLKNAEGKVSATEEPNTEENSLGIFTQKLDAKCLEAVHQKKETDSRFKHQGYSETVLGVSALVWDIIRTVKANEIREMKSRCGTVEMDSNIKCLTITILNVTSDEMTLATKMVSFAKALKKSEIDEIEIDANSIGNAPRWCEEIQDTFCGTGFFCIFIPDVKKVVACCETYDDILKIKHQFKVKEGKVKPTSVRRRRALNSQPDVHVPGDQSIGACAKTNCVVCSNSLSDPIVLDCGHVFCRDCITQQFQQRKVCPTCGKVCEFKTGEESRRSMAGSDIVGTVKLEKSTVLDVDAHLSDGVQLMADSDCVGSIKLENTTVSNVDSNSSDGVQLMADSDFAGSIKLENTTVSNVDSNSSDDDDVSLDNFELILRCVDKDGGCSMKILKAEIGFEALKWRYVFQNQDKRTKFEQKIKTLSATLVCKGELPVVIETNTVLKISTLSKNIKQFIQSETSELHVEEAIADADEIKRVIGIMSFTSSALTNQSVLRFIQRPQGQTKVWFVGVGKDVLEVLNLFKQTQKYLSNITPSGAT